MHVDLLKLAALALRDIFVLRRGLLGLVCLLGADLRPLLDPLTIGAALLVRVRVRVRVRALVGLVRRVRRAVDRALVDRPLPLGGRGTQSIRFRDLVGRVLDTADELLRTILLGRRVTFDRVRDRARVTRRLRGAQRVNRERPLEFILVTRRLDLERAPALIARLRDPERDRDLEYALDADTTRLLRVEFLLVRLLVDFLGRFIVTSTVETDRGLDLFMGIEPHGIFSVITRYGSFSASVIALHSRDPNLVFCADDFPAKFGRFRTSRIKF